MSNTRYINTSFWDDTYIISLDLTEKLLFLYLLTNPLTNIAGFYEISLKRIEFDTGIEMGVVEQALYKLSQDDKIYYIEGYIFIPNFIKNQSSNPSVKQGIKRILENLKSKSISHITIDCDRLYIACDRLSYLTKLNLTKLNLTAPKKIGEEEKKEKIKEFSEEVKKLSDFLFELMKKNNPNVKANPRNWDSDFDKLLRIDKRPYEESAKLLQLTQEDDFWKCNILSGAKFREKYDQLLLKMSKKTNSVAFIS